MRYFLLIIALFSLLLAPASAQAKLKKPRITDVHQQMYDTDCVTVTFRTVKRAASYEVRITNADKGRLRYRAGTSSADQVRDWRDISTLKLINVAINGNIRRQANWCNLAVNQTIRVRVRAVDAEGNAGPARKSPKFTLVEEPGMSHQWLWSNN